jgi:phosphopentomutase
MARAFILLLDSFGIGFLPDAEKFGDVGANTYLHIVRSRHGNLKIPNLVKLGINTIAKELAKENIADLQLEFPAPSALYGASREVGLGKDTSGGHWEIAGVPIEFEWGYFPPTYPSFPEELINKFIKEAKVPGILGNCHASGTEIINKFGDEHVKTGKPICYTSADSVFQIAAHEESFGLERLYQVCKIAFELVKPYHICRIIARPFLGSNGNYQRTEHRRDFSVPPPEPTLLDKLVEQGRKVIAIGKISDIFAAQGVNEKIEAHGNQEITEKALEQVEKAPDGSLVFANLVDFDMKYGHRRDIEGYAKALEEFDAQIPAFQKALRPDDLVIITADHGCDPTFKGSDHTREHIPILVFGPKIKPGSIGIRETFADIGQSIAKHLGIKPLKNGKAFV